jgi:dihydrofolate reductase
MIRTQDAGPYDPGMNPVVYYAAMSLDGYIAESDDTIEWLTGFPGVEPGPDVEPVGGGHGQEYEEFYADVGAMVSGSVTYEWILANAKDWPYAGKPYWVLSSRSLPVPDGQDVRFGDDFEEMIASAGDRKLWIVGGGGVASQFAAAGLLDDVWLTVVPVVLGDGKPVFDRRLPGPPMRLTGVLPRRSGMIELRFEVRT